jgi:hypothetical protein
VDGDGARCKNEKSLIPFSSRLQPVDSSSRRRDTCMRQQFRIEGTYKNDELQVFCEGSQQQSLGKATL